MARKPPFTTKTERRKGWRGPKLAIDVLMIGDPDECWASSLMPNNGGYSVIHRAVAKVVFGDIVGRDVHHTCGNRMCGNPLHLRVLERGVHRQQHMPDVCLNGHDLNDPLVTRTYRGARWCRICDRDRRRAYAARKS